jgi:hypothetical protein
MNRWIAAALAAGSVLQSTTVFADAIANASFSNITVQLVDLDPGDGIAPSVTFEGPSVAQTITIFSPDSQFSNVHNTGATSFGPVSETSAASPWNGASGSFSGDVYAGTGLATASARATGLLEPFGATASGLGEVEFGGSGSSGSFGFLLSPHTQLIVSGFADLEGEVTPGGYGQGTLSMMQMSIDADPSTGPFHTAALLRASLDATSPSSSVTNAMALSVSFSNDDATSASGDFFALLSASAASTVPEPPTSVLLLMSLAATGFAARGRRSRD